MGPFRVGVCLSLEWNCSEKTEIALRDFPWKGRRHWQQSSSCWAGGCSFARGRRGSGKAHPWLKQIWHLAGPRGSPSPSSESSSFPGEQSCPSRCRDRDVPTQGVTREAFSTAHIYRKCEYLLSCHACTDSRAMFPNPACCAEWRPAECHVFYLSPSVPLWGECWEAAPEVSSFAVQLSRAQACVTALAELTPATSQPSPGGSAGAGQEPWQGSDHPGDAGVENSHIFCPSAIHGRAASFPKSQSSLQLLSALQIPSPSGFLLELLLHSFSCPPSLWGLCDRKDLSTATSPLLKDLPLIVSDVLILTQCWFFSVLILHPLGCSWD